MPFNWKHGLLLLIILIVGYYLGVHKPGLLTKVTGGAIAA